MQKHRSKAFTIIEMLVVITIVAILLAIMLPALQKSRETVMVMKCAASLRAIGVADEAYRSDWNRWYVRDDEYVTLLAQYTGTLKEYYEWQGYGNSYIKYAKAYPFKCPLVVKGSEHDGAYLQGVGLLNGSTITDYSINTALHQAPSTNPYVTWRRDTQLSHTPSEVLNYADGRGTLRLDYSFFGAHVRHNAGAGINMLYADGHVALVQNAGIGLNRGGNNVTWFSALPYWWW